MVVEEITLSFLAPCRACLSTWWLAWIMPDSEFGGMGLYTAGYSVRDGHWWCPDMARLLFAQIAASSVEGWLCCGLIT
jgi:hypothetical protein